MKKDIICRLGGKDFLSVDDGVPPKPKGMHSRTYQIQAKRFEAYELQCNLHLLRLEERLRKM